MIQGRLNDLWPRYLNPKGQGWKVQPNNLSHLSWQASVSYRETHQISFVHFSLRHQNQFNLLLYTRTKSYAFTLTFFWLSIPIVYRSIGPLQKLWNCSKFDGLFQKSKEIQTNQKATHSEFEFSSKWQLFLFVSHQNTCHEKRGASELYLQSIHVPILGKNVISFNFQKFSQNKKNWKKSTKFKKTFETSMRTEISPRDLLFFRTIRKFWKSSRWVFCPLP